MIRSRLTIVVAETFQVNFTNPVVRDLIVGRQQSSTQELRVNNTSSGYSVIFKCEDFIRLDTQVLGDHLIKIFKTYFPNTPVHVEILYPIITENNIFKKCSMSVLQLDDFLSDIDIPNINYCESQSVKKLWELYNNEDEDKDDDDYDDEDEDDDDYDDEDEDDDDKYDYGIDDDNEEDDLSHINISEYYKKQSKDKIASTSRLIRGAKKTVKRHNIIVSSDKNAKRKDEKVIKSFLKDFIPGRSNWIRTYRDIVLDRWMDAFAISEKTAKRIKKAHRKQNSSGSKARRITRENAMGFTRKLIQGYDPFYDINR